VPTTLQYSTTSSALLYSRLPFSPPSYHCTLLVVVAVTSLDIHCVRQAGAGGWSWCGVREKHCYMAGGWRLELERCEREIL